VRLPLVIFEVNQVDRWGRTPSQWTAPQPRHQRDCGLETETTATYVIALNDSPAHQQNWRTAGLWLDKHTWSS